MIGGPLVLFYRNIRLNTKRKKDRKEKKELMAVGKREGKN